MKLMNLKLSALAIGLAALSGSALAGNCGQQQANNDSVGNDQAAILASAPMFWDMAFMNPAFMNPGFFNPAGQLAQLENSMNPFWMPAIYTPSFGAHQISAVQKTPQGYRVVLNLPGFKPGDVHVQVDGRTLKVSAQVSSNNQMKVGQQTERVRSEGSFAETLTLPGPVKASAIKQNFKGGMLTITLPSLKKTSAITS